VGFHKLAATAQQPTQFIDGDFELTGGDHFANFFDVFRSLSGASRMDQEPTVAARVATHGYCAANGWGSLASAFRSGSFLRLAFGHQRSDIRNAGAAGVPLPAYRGPSLASTEAGCSSAIAPNPLRWRNLQQNILQPPFHVIRAAAV
jgi:hypothetical protein